MTKPNLTGINLIVDSSGSMERLRQEANKALEVFVKEQSEQEGEVLWSITLFDSLQRERPVWLDATVEQAPTIIPGAMTPLYDAVGITVSDLGKAYAAMPEDERPSKVVVAIMTDGLENASSEWTGQAVRELVKRQQDEWNWDFIYMATGLDQATAERQSRLVGVAGGQTVNVDRGDHVHSYAGASFYVSEVRGGRLHANSGKAREVVTNVVDEKNKEQEKS